MLAPNTAHAGPAAQPNSAQIQLALRKLGVVGSVMYVAAHPDDENTNLLAYLANGRLLRTAYLSLTRGDGGQNLIGSEQGTDLGVIRTQELLAARRIDGAEQRFTRARDFGYSKDPAETLRIWGKDAVLADVVWAIRRFRPDVIVTRFSPLPSDTHGHHTASAQLTVEAFTAAADASFHPEQLGDGIEPWQARRIYWNRSSWSVKPGEDLSDFIKLDVNGYNPLLGLSYGEIAADSRSMHKSQGFGVARARGPMVEYFKLLGEDHTSQAAKHAVLDGLDLSWKRFKGSAPVERLVARAQKEFRPEAPEQSVPLLLQIDKALDAVADAGWRKQKKAEVRDLIAACVGLYAEVTAAQPRLTAGESVDVTVSAIQRATDSRRAPVRLREIRLTGAVLAHEPKTSVISVEQPLGSVDLVRRLQVSPDVLPSTPYWLALPPEPGLFHVADSRNVDLPATEQALQADLVFEVAGKTVELRRPVTFKWTDPVAGERYRPVEVAPLVSVEPQTSVLLLPNREPRSLSVRVTTPSSAVSGTLAFEVPPGWSVTPASRPFSLSGHDAQTDLLFRVEPPASAAVETGTLRVIAQVGAARFATAVTHIEHDHIPIQTVVKSSDVRAVAFPLDRQVGSIGYVPGPGDEVAASLSQAGYDVHTIADDALVPAELKRFDAVVTGVRAFNARERLRAAHAALMAYVHDGGTLVVQYNTNNRLAPLSAPLGPFPFEIGSERVTDENAAVTFTSPAHRLLAWPNRISPRDFEGWIQERGLYFAKSWDPSYETVLSMSDPGERQLSGGLLYARYGKGVFIYTGLSFFRQLPAGVPGAFRLFANLIAAGRRHDE